MRIDFIADTNFLVYLHEGHEIAENFLDYSFGISFISEVELLGYRGISQEQETALKLLIADCHYLDWNTKIKEKTIDLRKRFAIKLPDAIIAATSALYKIPLVTADKDFLKITDMDIILLDV